MSLAQFIANIIGWELNTGYQNMRTIDNYIYYASIFLVCFLAICGVHLIKCIYIRLLAFLKKR